MGGGGLKALVLGSGYAAEGHTIALQRAGVEVVAMASRNEDVCRKRATSLGIARHGTDWRGMIAETRPDIVAVATPAGVHNESVKAAIEHGCHLYCEKPLALNASDARELYRLAEARGVKTAYAATCRYQPQVLYARELVESGALGEVNELEFVSHVGQPRLMPFGWIHRLESGGGRLYNHFPHLLAIAENIVGGRVLAVMGECRTDIKRAPVAETIHDLRDFAKLALSPEAAARGDHAEVTSDFRYTVLARVGRPGESLDRAVTAIFRHGVVQVGKNADYIAVYGEKGTIHIEHQYGEGAMFLRTAGGGWQELTVPQRIVDTVPGPGLWPQRLWTRLAVELVNDILGSGTSDYLTFRDGWIYQEIIDIVRQGKGWTAVPVVTVSGAPSGYMSTPE